MRVKVKLRIKGNAQKFHSSSEFITLSFLLNFSLLVFDLFFLSNIEWNFSGLAIISFSSNQDKATPVIKMFQSEKFLGTFPLGSL